jgi:peroxiredoxin
MGSMTRLGILALAALLALACGGGGTDGDTDAATDTAGDTSSDVPLDGGDYPAGPYGTSAGDTIENLSFTTTTGGSLDLASFYNDPASKVLLVFATAGWCTVCAEEAGDLPGIYSEYHPQGLDILAAVFEDASSDPADAADAANYADHYGFSFATVADDDLETTGYFDKTTAPMNMLIDLCTMEIISIETGYDAGGLRSDIESALAGVGC